MEKYLKRSTEKKELTVACEYDVNNLCRYKPYSELRSIYRLRRYRKYLFLYFVFLALFFVFIERVAADVTDTSVSVKPLEPPSDFTATAVSTNRIDLSWSSVSDAVSYKVYRDGSLITSPTTTFYSDTGLSPKTTYSYTISAVNIYGGESAQSSSVSATTPGVGGGGLPPAAYNPPTPPAEGFSVVINNGTLETDSREVTLTLVGGSDTARMAISNFSDFRYAVQEPYQTTKTWVLIAGEDLKTVYVKFYTSWGQSSEVVSDTISLVAPPTPPPPLSPEAKKVDANDDGSINVLDFNILIINWGATTLGNIADFNEDGIVDIFDFNLLMIHWQI